MSGVSYDRKIPKELKGKVYRSVDTTSSDVWDRGNTREESKQEEAESNQNEDVTMDVQSDKERQDQ